MDEYQDLEIFPEREMDWIRLCIIGIRMTVSFIEFGGWDLIRVLYILGENMIGFEKLEQINHRLN